MAKKEGINKAAEIRAELKKNPKARGTDIAAAIKKRLGVEVSEAQVSNIRNKKKKKGPKAGKKGKAGKPNNDTGVFELTHTIAFVKTAGGLSAAKAALADLESLIGD